MPDYSLLDKPIFSKLVFFPRQEITPCPEKAFDLPVQVDDNASISCRFYPGDAAWPWLIYFHGNGEVVSDYDDLAPIYNQIGLNIVVTDYRGYGASTGDPSFTNLLKDAKSIFSAVKEQLSVRGYPGELWVMGRSLGSLSALELASHNPEELKGMIIESGFADISRVMKHLGHLPAEISLPRFNQECLDLVSEITIPALVIHGQEDNIVPVQEAKDLFEHLGASRKKLLLLPGADHNDLMYTGFRQYFEAIQEFITGISEA
ncbi:MAG: alpha/beta fold hydrolase [Desulfotomaculaceae bacterium]|nr:alpha/beta fold hydrolase [Desulfotomaculaceae bacterium]